MLKPQMPNIPGVGAMSDTLDFVKNLWGSMSVPGMNIPGVTAPSMSVEDLDKKIADLKAVEAWLNVNGTMLRGTIQALEIQRGTIATLKSMGATLANAVKQPGANEKTVLAAAPYVSAFFSQPPAEAPKVEVKPEVKAEVKAPAPAAAPAAAAAPAPEPAKENAALNAAAALTNPAAWWNMLQDQFKAAVSTAMSSDAMAGAGALAQGVAAKGLNKAMGKTIAKVAPKAPKAPAKKRAPAKPKAVKPE